ncbi:MAG: thermonuclease family protein [Metamycoplasmataceae bacterium]
MKLVVLIETNVNLKKMFKRVFLNTTKIFMVSIPLLPLTSCIDNNEYTYITRIIDGDTFEDNNNLRYRLLGVDTPESFDSSNNFKPTIGIQKFYATKATNLSHKTINNKTVTIKNWKFDTYKRMVTRINYGSIELSSLLLKSGLARVKYISKIEGNFFYYPDINYYDQLIDSENYAKINKIGLWSLSEYELKLVFPK